MILFFFFQVAAYNKGKKQDWMKVQKYLKQKVLNPSFKAFLLVFYLQD